MVVVTFRNGQPVMRDGSIATGSDCCPCLSLELFSVIVETEGSGALSIIQDTYDFFYKPLVDALQQNLEDAGWDVTRSDDISQFFVETNGQQVEHARLEIHLSATCECCIDLELFLSGLYCGENQQSDQPEGMWVDVSPFLDDGQGLLPFNPLFLKPFCSFSCPPGTSRAPYGINGVLSEIWVPVCDPTAEHCNPLP